MNEEAFIKASGLPFLESAGGLMVNDDGLVLFILKGGKWDLPKGRIENGTDCRETAIREMSEETAAQQDRIRILSPLCSTWHVTSYATEKFIKKTHWFFMRYEGKGDGLIPQIEEGITECRWVHPDDFSIYRGDMRVRIDYVTNLWKKVFFRSSAMLDG